MKIEWYAKYEGAQEVKIEGTERAIENFKHKFLVKDIHGNYLEEGDEIQGFNNRKYASDKIRLFETGVMKVTYPKIYEYFYGKDDTFEPHLSNKKPWIWKV